MTPGLNPHCALVRRLGEPAYESCKSCELRLQNCIQFRGQLYATGIVGGVLGVAFVPMPGAARTVLAAVVVGVVFHFLRYVARESQLSIETGARLRKERAEAITNLRTLQATRDQLIRADKLATLGTMAAGVAHEINNPLSFVLSNLRFVREELEAHQGSPLDGELASAIGEAVAGGERVRKIVSDLTSLSRVEEAKRGPTDVRETMQSALTLARNEVRHRARILERYEEAPRAMADASKLGQVFLNLIVNAVHAMGRGSAADNQLTLGLAANGPWVVATVTDTGSGIPPQNIPRLFEPFFTTKPAGVGTGLGLAICQNIVVSMGGEIAVTSEVGRGSTFTIRLPIAPEGAAEASAPEARVAAAAPARRARVLVIDDEALVGRTLTRILKGHEVVCFTDAIAALKAIDADPRFDLVLCDVMMPELSGDEFHALLAASHPHLAELTVFMTGGAFTQGTRAFVESLDPRRRVAKPFDEALLRRLADGDPRPGP